MTGVQTCALPIYKKKKKKTIDIGEKVRLIRSMIIIHRLVYEDGKELRVGLGKVRWIKEMEINGTMS